MTYPHHLVPLRIIDQQRKDERVPRPHIKPGRMFRYRCEGSKAVGMGFTAEEAYREWWNVYLYGLKNPT